MKLQTIPLKFRVWDKEENRFRHWCDEPIEMDLWRLHELFDLSDEEEYEHYIVSQDTGLKDKNGKSIFIGDILFNGIYYVEVRYENGEVVGYIPKDDVYCGFLEQMQLRGNIWQNKELLEEK